MKQFKEYLGEASSGRDPFSPTQIQGFIRNSGDPFDFEGYEYGGYAKGMHVYAIIWEDKDADDMDTNYAINIMYVRLSQNGKIEAIATPMPEEEDLHMNTASTLAKKIARKEAQRVSKMR